RQVQRRNRQQQRGQASGRTAKQARGERAGGDHGQHSHQHGQPAAQSDRLTDEDGGGRRTGGRQVRGAERGSRGQRQAIPGEAEGGGRIKRRAIQEEEE